MSIGRARSHHGGEVLWPVVLALVAVLALDIAHHLVLVARLVRAESGKVR